MEEEWKEITNFPNYAISSFGNVKNIKSGKILKQRNTIGYKSLGLHSNGIMKTWLVHRLVALHFILNPENKPTVNHIDMCPSNNNVNNLEWATLSEQQQHNIKNKKPLAFGYGYARKEIIQFNLETNENIQEFPSITLACEWLYNNGYAKFKEFNFNTICSLRSKLLNCVKRKKHSIYGFGWRFRDQTISDEQWIILPPEFINDNQSYFISNLGRIKSPKGKIINQNTFSESNTVSINKKTYYAHRLVAFAFLPNPENKPFVYHNDGNKRNNEVTNLRWDN